MRLPTPTPLHAPLPRRLDLVPAPLGDDLITGTQSRFGFNLRLARAIEVSRNGVRLPPPLLLELGFEVGDVAEWKLGERKELTELECGRLYCANCPCDGGDRVSIPPGEYAISEFIFGLPCAEDAERVERSM